MFLAYDTRLDRRVALKLVEIPADGAAARRLLREARNAAALNHPNICTVYEASEANGSAFIAMEYVPGRSLRERLDEGALDLTDAIRYDLQVAEALAYAHDQGVVHRDLKAANAIVTEGGRLKIVDFGLCWLPVRTIGSPGMSPSTVAPGGTMLVSLRKQSVGATASWRLAGSFPAVRSAKEHRATTQTIPAA